MPAASIYATGLALLGVWGLYASRKTFQRGRKGSWRHARSLLVLILFTGSCIVCAVSLGSGRFRAWMAAPLGLSYALQIPMPCYFESVDRIRWLHTARNFLFGLVAIGCLAIAVGVVPLSWIGL